MSGAMQFHENIEITSVQVGDEKSPIIIIDNFVNEPNALIESAIESVSENYGFQSQASDFYPGVRKPAPASYQALLNKLGNLLSAKLPSASIVRADSIMSAYSIATTPVKSLRPIQMIPHFDSPEPKQYALVHYLCDEHHGGTSFYKHKATGFERITQDRLANYGQTIKHEAIKTKLHTAPQYINGDSELFTKIHSIDAAMNRAIIYPSNLLHSGNIQAQLGLKPSPTKGRLTISSFINIQHN